MSAGGEKGSSESLLRSETCDLTLVILITCTRVHTCVSKVLRHCSRAGTWSLTDWAAYPEKSAGSPNPWQLAADPGASATGKKTTGVGGFVCWEQRSGESCPTLAFKFGLAVSWS